ncbi:MAG: adenylyltransferase/cytidyltransferase family protein [Mariprofundaceae bacterium]|nr:adenylyltransferase/cytidyltransferase family protein [Mariprofundaceae bacterium]
MTTEFFEKYRHKILTVEEIQEKVGAFPRAKKAIMCHGVFDVVHPGHVRHLAYAKSKADMLIASITSDRHINKGAYRPHVPEQLRALNLAAFEMVDYVLIDKNAKPLDNVRAIKPDFFAKGFEYTSSGLPKATQEETDIVEAYGGAMIFTPGDVVYSSTNLINLELPKIEMEKLLMLMQEYDITFDNLRTTLMNLKGRRVHVVGDTIVDSYTRSTLIGGQTKTPTFSVLYQGCDNYIGGAGIVAQHLRAAGAEVVFSTVLGDDALKDFVLEGLKESGIESKAIIDKTRPTVNKNAIIAGGYRLLKIDTLDNRSISDHIVEELVEAISSTPTDAVVFSDFRHGMFNRMTVSELTKAIPDDTYRVADSQVASRWGNIIDFQEFDLITPNEREARFALADQDSTVGRLGGKLLEETKGKLLMMKLGARGVFVLECLDEDGNDNFFSIDSFANNVVDAVGAGDALLAYSTLSMMTSNSPLISAILGSMAAACECEFDGNIPIKPEDVLQKIDAVEKMANYQ